MKDIAVYTVKHTNKKFILRQQDCVYYIFNSDFKLVCGFFPEDNHNIIFTLIHQYIQNFIDFDNIYDLDFSVKIIREIEQIR